MNIKEQYWKYSLITIVLVFGLILFTKLSTFLSGFLGALTIYILVRKQMIYLTEKRKLKRNLSALIISTEAVLCFLIPVSLFVWLLVSKLQNINLDPQIIIAPIEQVAAIIKEKTGYDVLSSSSLSFIVTKLPDIGQAVMGGIGSFAVNLFVMIFVLYFMLVGGTKMEGYIKGVLPFNENNAHEVTHKINKIIRANAIGIPLLALIQGTVALIGYFIFGAPNALLVGFLTCFATVIPMVGTALVWVPVTVYLALTGDWVNAIGLGLYGGLVISQCDNLIRFLLQKKMANTHPLITIFGVIVGLRLFGFMGVIFGPLLLALFLLFVDMFKKEYLDGQK